MSRLMFKYFVVLFAAGFVAVGCRTTGHQQRASISEESFSDGDIEKRAKAQAHFSSGIIHELGGNTTAAMESFYQAGKANPADEELLLDVTGRLIEAKQFEKALEVLTLGTSNPDANGMIFIRLGFVYAQLGRPEKSAEANRIAVARMPEFLPGWQNLFLNQLQAGKPALAMKVLDEAASQSGTNAEFQIGLAELYANLGRQFPDQRTNANSKAVEIFKRVAAGGQATGVLQLKLGDGFNLLGETGEATKIYLEIIEHSAPSSPLRDILRTKLTDIYLRGDDHARAQEQLAAIVRENPSNAGAHYFLGAIAIGDKRWTDAIESFRRALVINPDFEQANYELITAQIGAGKGEEAVATIEALQAKRGTNFNSEYLLAMAYQEQKKYADAVKHLSTAETIAQGAETNRLNAGFYFQFGAAYERNGQRSEAEKCFEKCLKLEPDNADAMNYLGYMWAEKGEKLERAKVLIERAVKLEPDNAAFLDSMGWVFYQIGKPKEAVDWLLKAIAAAPKEPDATVYDHLGDAYAASKQMDKAREAWAKSVSLEASQAVQDKISAAEKSRSP